MMLLVSMVFDRQAALLVMITLTWSPVVSELFEYVVLFVPTFMPLSFHW